MRNRYPCQNLEIQIRFDFRLAERQVLTFFFCFYNLRFLLYFEYFLFTVTHMLILILLFISISFPHGTYYNVTYHTLQGAWRVN